MLRAEPVRSQMVRCFGCRQYVSLLFTKFGNRNTFDAKPVPIDQLGERQGWAPGRWPVRGIIRTTMSPIEHYSRDARAAMKAVVVLHDCPTPPERRSS